MDTEPTLILDNINVFITVVARARVEDLERDLERVGKALKWLCEFLAKERRYEIRVDACIYYNRNEIKKGVNDNLLKNMQDKGESRILTEALFNNDKETLSIYYLAEVPFIRLDLSEITIKLGNDFPVEGLKNRELRCHLTAIVHRLGAAAVTCWVKVPTQLTVENTNRLIQALMKEQVKIEMQYIKKNENTTLRNYLIKLANILLASLIQILREEIPGPEGMQRKGIRRYIENIYTDYIVLHAGGVSMKKEDGNTTPITSVRTLLKCYPRQVASLASGRIDWRSYTLDEAVEYNKGALAAIYQNQLIMIGSTRGVVIYLEAPSEPGNPKKVNNAPRDPDHERHYRSVLQSFADNLLQIYQLVGIVKTTLETYNFRIRRHSPMGHIPGKIARLVYLVEEGLEEIDNYSLSRIEFHRKMIHMALERSGVLKLRKVVERRLTYTHRTLAMRYSEMLTLTVALISMIIGIYNVLQSFPTEPHIRYVIYLVVALLLLITILFIISITIDFAYRAGYISR